MGLIPAGMGSATALAEVILFRLVTFSTSLLLGWVGFALLQHNGDL